MAKKGLTQHPERYSKEIKTNQWKVQAGPSVKPLLLPIGKEVGDLKPLISADGIIVELFLSGASNSVYLVSPKTLQDIKDSDNPHYTSGDSGKVMGAQIGKSIPVIKLDSSMLETISLKQLDNSTKSGVKDAVYLFEGEQTDGVPNKLLKQIDYTLLQDAKREDDSFELWNIELQGNYSIEKLVVETAQSGSKVDLDRLAKLLTGVNERLAILRDDFNVIKDVYYNGKVPEGTKGWNTITKPAGDNGEDVSPTEGEQVVFKYAEIISVEPTPTDFAQQTADEATIFAEKLAMQAQANSSNVKQYRFVKETNLQTETLPIYKDKVVRRNRLFAGDTANGIVKRVREGATFWAERLTDSLDGTPWLAVYDDNRTILIGYALQSSRVIEI